MAAHFKKAALWPLPAVRRTTSRLERLRRSGTPANAAELSLESEDPVSSPEDSSFF
jgi:hypothetical protein